MHKIKNYKHNKDIINAFSKIINGIKCTQAFKVFLHVLDSWNSIILQTKYFQTTIGSVKKCLL